jgi:hypothetical protein
MAASLSSSPLLLVAAAHDNSDDLATALFIVVLLLTPLVLLTIALWNKRFPRTSAVGQRAESRKRAPLYTSQAASPSPAPAVILARRVISLYSTTPGQSPFEYNIGDTQGTRGSALARLA